MLHFPSSCKNVCICIYILFFSFDIVKNNIYFIFFFPKLNLIFLKMKFISENQDLISYCLNLVKSLDATHDLLSQDTHICMYYTYGYIFDICVYVYYLEQNIRLEAFKLF